MELNLHHSSKLEELHNLRLSKRKLHSNYQMNVDFVRFYANHKNKVLLEKRRLKEAMEKLTKQHLGEENFQVTQTGKIFRELRSHWNQYLTHYSNTRDEIYMYIAMQLQTAFHNIGRKYFGKEKYDAAASLPEFQRLKKRSDLLKRCYFKIMRVEKKIFKENENLLKKIKNLHSKITYIESLL